MHFTKTEMYNMQFSFQKNPLDNILMHFIW